VSGNPDWLVVLHEEQAAVWLLAVVFYGIGDTVTTAVGLRSTQTAEAGPVASTFVESAGIAGLVSLKIVFFLASFALWYAVQRPSRVAIPLAIAVAGIGVTVWNAVMLAL